MKTAGDTVLFSLASSHNAVEVSQTTWNSNANTPLPGFETPYGGGLVLPTQLSVGTRFKKGTFEIYDLQGVRIISASNMILQSSNGIDLSNYPKGMYFVKLVYGSTVFVSKIIIQ